MLFNSKTGSKFALSFVFLIGLFTPALCQAYELKPEVIRIYWNPELTETNLQVSDVADTVVAYVVIENSSFAGRVESLSFRLEIGGATPVGESTQFGDISLIPSYLGLYNVSSYSDPFRLEFQTVVCTLKFLLSDLSAISVSIYNSYFYSDTSQYKVLTNPFNVRACGWINPEPAQGSLQESVLEFEGRAAGVTSFGSILIENGGGGGPLILSPEFMSTCEHFVYEGSPYQEVIDPYYSLMLNFRFTPDDVNFFSCTSEVAPGIEVTLQGFGEEPAPVLEGPLELSFKATAVGGRDLAIITVRNVGNIETTIDPIFLDPCLGVRLASDFFVKTILPGETHSFTVEFWPTVVGVSECDLVFGEGGLTTHLTGTAFVGESMATVSPSEIEFGIVGTYSQNTQTINIFNVGDTVLYPNYQFENLDPIFETATVPPRALFPNTSTSLVVTYVPRFAGTYSTNLLLGPDIPSVPISATVIDDPYSIVVSPRVLYFDPTNPGESDTKSFEVTNTGIYDYMIELTTISELVTGLPPGRLFAPGETASIPVTYAPEEYGQFEFRIILNSERVEFIECIGPPKLAFNEDQNRVGLFFDSAYTSNESIIEAEAQTMTAFLVMLNPTIESGLGGWECKIDASPGVALLSYELEGNVINANTGFEFTVGLALEPLPYSSEILLGTFELIVYDFEEEEFRLSLAATSKPSIPGMMSWVPWDDLENLTPMVPFTGDSTVAWIRIAEPVALAVPTPVIDARPGGLELSWPNTAPLDGGYNVYRRIESDMPVRLNVALVTSDQETVVFVDELGEVEPGAVLYYSYRLVIAGVEVGDSPEVTFISSNNFPRVTRLGANYPNPFNPQTTISFELADPSLVRIDIYDVTGRRVRRLVEAHFAAGSYERKWTGANDNGRGLASGTYYVRMTTKTQVDTRKVTLLK